MQYDSFDANRQTTTGEADAQQATQAMGGFRKFINGRGFYMVLLACLAAVGALAFALTGTSSNVAERSVTPEGQQVQLIPGGGLAEQATAAPSATPSATQNATEKATPTVRLALPVEGEVLKPYTTDQLLYSATLNEWATHAGLDIAALSGTDVKAALAGRVESAVDDPEYGLCVTLAHADNGRTIYGNLSAIADGIQEGATVETGTVLGQVGTTAPVECKDAAHLHFAYIVNGKSVDPQRYMDGIAGSTAAPTDGIK